MDWRRELLAEEKGSSYKSGGVEIGLVYPNSYFVGMSNLGFQTVYNLLNRIPGISCQRIFLDTHLISLEKGNSLKSFELLAFSVSFELDYVNVLRILDVAGIPLHSQERDDSHPLIIAGGFALSSNPEPLSSFIDVFVLGDGEEVVQEFMNVYLALRQKASRNELLRNLADIRGVYVPGLDGRRPVERRCLNNLDSFDTVSSILTPNTEFADMFLIELTRGCPMKCKFCLAGSVCKPFRVRSLNNVIELAESGLKYTNRVGLISLEVNSYPDLGRLLSEIVERGGTVSLSSFRPGKWQKEILDALKKSKQNLISIAPETGSEELRKLIGKDISDDSWMELISASSASGIKQLKLYFLIGLPGETDSDIEALIKLIERVRKSTPGSKRITASVNPFVPKPATPFQWCRMEDAKVLTKRLQMLQSGLKKLRGVNLIHESIKWSIWQGILSRGDREVGKAIELTYRTGGNWQRAFRELGMSAESYLRERKPDDVFP